MDTAARRALARALAARLQARYGDALLLAGMVGSAVRGDDTPYSDLDMVVVARDGAAIATRTFLFQGIPVSLRVITEPVLTAELHGPGLEWPYWMGVLEVLQPLAGDPAHVARWQAMGLAQDERSFRVMVERLLPELVFEAYGRVRSCAARGNERDAPALALEVVYELKTALCLLNRRWVTRDYYAGIEQSFGFPLIPEGYAELAPRLLDARELATIVPLAGQLVASYWKLLAVLGATVQNYQKLDDVPV
ncbi:MAG: hypothetical protein OHK0015_32310 [Chloroflexi bacterium OHK40]